MPVLLASIYSMACVIHSWTLSTLASFQQAHQLPLLSKVGLNVRTTVSELTVTPEAQGNIRRIRFQVAATENDLSLLIINLEKVGCMSRPSTWGIVV
jgi:hypothetical protein